MGSPFNIVFFETDSSRAADLAAACFKLVDSFNLIFSDYNDSSELGKINKSAMAELRPVDVSPALYEVLSLSKTAFYKSEGAFDITIGPLVKLWRRMRKYNLFPPTDTVQLTRKLVGFKSVAIDTIKRAVTLKKTGMKLDLGGIAKGWIAQQVIDFLTSQHVLSALADAGGDIAMSDAPPGANGWKIGVNVPETTDELLSQSLVLKNTAVATSGDAYQFIEYGGKKYSHIIDPRTGYGVTSQRNVTVIAGDGATADWLATACSILPVNKAKALAEGLGAAVMIAEIKDRKLIFHLSKSFKKYWKQPQ